MFLKDIYYLSKIWRNPRTPFKDIKNLQLKKLKSLLNHAYTHSGFYHDKFRQAGIHPDDINSLQDLSKIPLTTKEELMDATQVVAQNIPSSQHQIITTSGSTGKKLKIVHSADFISFNIALFYRTYFHWGMRPFKKLSYIRYTPLSESELYSSTEKYFMEKLGIAQFFYISTFLEPEKQLELLWKQRPHILVGHPPDLVMLAKTARATSKKLQFEFIGSNSELLTQKERDYIEETFSCPVYNEYSSLEVGYIARDCREQRMHLVSDSVIVEFLKDGEPVAPGEKGDVVVTLLFNTAMPFIRYNQGDVASLSEEKCECGITFPVMDVIEGRKDDFLVLPSGREVPPTTVVPIFFHFDSIREFNVIQVSSQEVVVHLVCYGVFEEKEEEELVRLLQNELTEMDITIEYVDEIEKTQRGKKRAVVNLV